MYFSEKSNQSKKYLPQKRAKRAGEKLTLSQLSNPNCAGYISDIKTALPDQLRYNRDEVENEKLSKVMKTVRPSRNIGSEKNAPIRVGKVKLNGGILEVGYDEKKDDLVFSFVNYNISKTDQQVYEASSTTKPVHFGDEFMGKDQDFAGDAIDVRTKQEQQLLIRQDFTKLSDDKEHGTTVDKVMPFARTQDEQDKIQQLRDMKSKDNSDRSNIHNAISAVETLKSKKNQKQVDFVQKFTRAVRDAKEIKSKFTSNDDYVLYLRKKWLMMYEQSDLPDPDDEDNNEDSVFKNLVDKYRELKNQGNEKKNEDKKD